MSKDSPTIDQGRRRFLINTTSVIGGIGVAAAAVPFVASWAPSAKARAAGAPTEADVGQLEAGALMVLEWRGKPVWVIRRTETMLESLKTDHAKLRDPESQIQQQPNYAKNEYRSIKPEYLVLVGVCTHLGCAPAYRPEVGSLSSTWRGGFFCPCHGSSFDLAGRVYKGVPAPINLEVPPYHFVNDHTILVGEGPNSV